MRVVVIICALVGAVVAMGQNFGTSVYKPVPVEAKVAPYTVKADLGNVENAKILPKLTAEQQKLLSGNGFLARPTVDEQLFYVYENNAYQKIPTFVTTDSVLHTYHVFYDFTLRYLEKEKLMRAVKELSKIMLAENLWALSNEKNARLKTAFTRNSAYFAVPLLLAGMKPELPDEVSALAAREIARIEAHNTWGPGLTGAQVDYSQFVPRGHYTRSEDFKLYFKQMMWYGLVPMNMRPDPKATVEENMMPVLQALTISQQLDYNGNAAFLWARLYDPTVFYVGKADDIAYTQLLPLITKKFGAGEFSRFDDAAKIDEFRKLVQAEVAGPGIANYNWLEGGVQGQQFRFMGQRFIPDSRYLQELVHPKVGTEDVKRGFPMGLDVPAVLGNTRAADLLDNTYQQPKYENYLKQRAKLQKEVAALTLDDWKQNLYYGWMYCLQPLNTPVGDGYPSFMRNQAWQDKSLVTFLGSWTELRHDTLLYAKQSVVAECGDGEDTPPPPRPGYVEPQVELYERLSWLLKYNKEGLVSRQLVEDGGQLAEQFNTFTDLVDFLAVASRKELRNEDLSADELRQLERYGGTMESLTLTIIQIASGTTGNTGWWDITNNTDRNMALVADVHTYNDEVLEEGVGKAAEIWVVVPFRGKLVLTRGATFSYYEFQQPSENRLTDEAWQEMLLKGTAPAMPDWTKSFMLQPGRTTPTSQDELSNGDDSGGC